MPPSEATSPYHFARPTQGIFHCYKRRCVNDVDWNDVRQRLRKLQTALEKNSQITCRMANSGDLLGSSPKNKMTELGAEIFRGGNVTITLCRGKIEVSPVGIRSKIMAEKYQGAIHMTCIPGRNQRVHSRMQELPRTETRPSSYPRTNAHHYQSR